MEQVSPFQSDEMYVLYNVLFSVSLCLCKTLIICVAQFVSSVWVSELALSGSERSTFARALTSFGRKHTKQEETRNFFSRYQLSLS